MSERSENGAPRRAVVSDLLDRYDGILLDAYGVLVDARGALPGAAELVTELKRRGIPFLVATNDASRLPRTLARRFRGFGLDVTEEAFLTSGQLLPAHFAERDLVGGRCMVLGTDDSRRMVEAAGGVVCDIDGAAEYDAVVVCDDDGFPFLDGVNAAISTLFRAFDRDVEVALVLPNPDLIFPAGDGAYGITSGSIALLVEAALERRYPDRELRFTRLGKPHRPLFDEAVRRLGSERLLMIGDQLETDIAGARARGLDAALLATGVSRWREGGAAAVVPTWLLDGLR